MLVALRIEQVIWMLASQKGSPTMEGQRLRFERRKVEKPKPAKRSKGTLAERSQQAIAAILGQLGLRREDVERKQ